MSKVNFAFPRDSKPHAEILRRSTEVGETIVWDAMVFDRSRKSGEADDFSTALRAPKAADNGVD